MKIIPDIYFDAINEEICELYSIHAQLVLDVDGRIKTVLPDEVQMFVDKLQDLKICHIKSKWVNYDPIGLVIF